MTTKMNRRNFLSMASAAGLLGLSGAAFSPNANAANVEGYKALVCLFLDGGMDQSDTVLPYDQASHDALGEMRQGLFSSYGVGTGQSSRDIENLLELSPTNSSDFGGRKFALPNELSPLKSLFDAGNAAIIGNVGPLVVPLDRTSFESPNSVKPKRLFSHNDQRSTWMSQGTEGTRYGWGGKFADIMSQADTTSDPKFAAISANNNSVFLAGETVRQFAAPVSGAANYNYLTKKWLLSSGRNSDVARQILKEHFASQNHSSENLYMKDMIGYKRRSIENLDAFLPAYESAPILNTMFPDTKLGEQLKTVAETISVQLALNVNRQVFYVRLGGFDTHDNQANELPKLHSDLAQSIASFYAALSELGMENNVTLFTGSDFGRTLLDNGDGTDHGWGGHQFVVGGAVKGNQIYGELPEIDLSSQRYTEKRGRLIPGVSVDQYAATLGAWFGLSPTELRAIFPNLVNFDSDNLGFI